MGKRRIARQKRLIARLSRGERDTTTAHEILRALESHQAMFLEHRDRIERQLETVKPA